MGKYSAKQEKLRRRRSPRSKEPFIQLHHYVKRTETYEGLSLAARCTLIELLDKYTGINNGMIPMSVRELAERLRCSFNTAARALRELDDAGLARATEIIQWPRRKATTYRLTFKRCDKTGDFPIKKFSPPVRSRKQARCDLDNRQRAACAISETQTPKNPINHSTACAISETHIDIYHTEGELRERSECEGGEPHERMEDTNEAGHNRQGGQGSKPEPQGHSWPAKRVPAFDHRPDAVPFRHARKPER
jgi:DNA-binding Lrp family transcriptional regulator